MVKKEKRKKQNRSAVPVQQPQLPQREQLPQPEQLPQLVPQPIAESSSMEYYSLPAGTGPPEIGAKYTKLHWPLHQINALSQGPLKGDYKLDENNVKFYPIENNGFVVPCCSSFVPLNSRHNVPSQRLLGPESPCYFLSPGTVLPDGLSIVYTKKMKTRFPSGLQYSWHFNIFPTRSMTLTEYSNMIKNLDWKPCNIKAGASPDKLVSKNDDTDGLKSIEILGLYFLMLSWYDQANNSMDRLQANEIHTWISLDKPTFQDLICDEDRSFYVFSTLSQLKTESVTLETYRADILDELEDRFMWKESDFFDPRDYHIEDDCEELVSKFEERLKIDDRPAVKSRRMLQKIAKKFIRQGDTLVYQRIFIDLLVKHYCKMIDIDDDGKFTVTLTINGEEKQKKNITEITPLERWIINEDDRIRGNPPSKNPYEPFSLIDSNEKYQDLSTLRKLASEV